MTNSKGFVGFLIVATVSGLVFFWQGVHPPSAPPRVSYTVVKGDTLSQIARSHGVSVALLQEWNGLSTDRIEVGAVLWVGPSANTDGAIVDKANPKRTRASASSGSAARAAPSAPGERPCRPGPSLDEGEDGPAFAAAEGLSMEEVQGVMNAAQSRISGCISGEWPEGSVHLTMTVACSGRVARVVPSRVRGLSADLVDCVVRTVQETPFPTHALPDGDTFEYPLTFSL